MTDNALNVVGIGNAIVDVLSRGDDTFLDRHGLVKGAMSLIDADTAEAVYGAMGPGVEVSGGSAANSMAGIASLGGTSAFIGKVRDDLLGDVFTHDIRAIGVRYETPPASTGLGTARCLIVVTPDAQRTMQTFLGASQDLGPDEIDSVTVAAAEVTYLEGYLFDPPKAKEAFVKAAKIAHEAGRRVALTLSDQFCVDRHRDDFRNLVEGHVDVLFANESEILSLYEAPDFDAALQAVRGKCDIVALTRSEKGSVLLRGSGEVHVIDAAPVDKVVDTTGAGDLYAAGVLYGLTNGLDLPTSGRIGSIAAAEVIGHMGARPETPLKDLVAGLVAG